MASALTDVDIQEVLKKVWGEFRLPPIFPSMDIMVGYGLTDGTLLYWRCRACECRVEKDDFDVHMLWHKLKEAP